jgi:hypothetical protein
MLDRLRTHRSEDSEREPEAGPSAAASRRLTTCPNCGAHRPGEFRFCRSCGFDYDIAERASSVQPWLANPAEAAGAALERSGGRHVLEPERRADTPETLVRSEGRLRVGAGRYALTPRQVIVAAIAVGLAAAAIVSLFGLIVGR